MKKLAYLTLTLAFLSLSFGMASLSAQASVEVGKAAPAFTATDVFGQEFKLEDQKGKVVVLEWTNHDCPFVKKHYDTNNMQNTQKTATDTGVVWVSIVSSAPGKQGHVTPEQAQEILKEKNVNVTTQILDPTGEIGKLYNAKTTPHMFVIGTNGNVAYAGAIDNNRSPSPDAINGAKNLVLAALEDLSLGRVIGVPQTAPYGCSVKY